MKCLNNVLIFYLCTLKRVIEMPIHCVLIFINYSYNIFFPKLISLVMSEVYLPRSCANYAGTHLRSPDIVESFIILSKKLSASPLYFFI